MLSQNRKLQFTSSNFNTELIDQLLSDSQTENNVFMIKDSKIIKAFSAKNIQIGYPYHLCIEPKEKTAFIME